ncbi:MAG: hypothetical protein HY719_07340 [Planctomycetes bacterium]|nr:hypothetical protein [Planctomycetota bacterium]
MATLRRPVRGGHDRSLTLPAPARPDRSLTLAALGGWKDTKRTGRVGWEALWRGWDRLQERVTGYRVALAAGAG